MNEIINGATLAAGLLTMFLLYTMYVLGAFEKKGRRKC